MKFNLYSINEVSKILKIPSSTLRYYEQVGILPEIKRNKSGQRVFTDKHINRIYSICCFKNTGMTIAQMKEFFSYEDDECENIDAILMLLEKQKEIVSKQIEQLKKDYIHVRKKLCYYYDIKQNFKDNKPIPCWNDYENMTIFDDWKKRIFAKCKYPLLLFTYCAAFSKN